MPKKRQIVKVFEKPLVGQGMAVGVDVSSNTAEPVSDVEYRG